MLKGVSQKVIEVVRTDNQYFEKAILFLRPTVTEVDKNQLRTHAWDYLGEVEYHPTLPEKGSFWKSALYLGISAMVGAAVTCLFFLL